VTLPAAQHADMVGAYRTAVQLLGGDFQHVDGTGTARVVQAHFVDPKPDDTALINALGLETRIAHTLVITPAPQKFDRLISPPGREYDVRAVHEIIVGNTLVGYKLYMVG
jgi:hypothetical protein